MPAFPTTYCIKQPTEGERSCEARAEQSLKCNEHGEVCGSGEAPLVSRIYRVSILDAILLESNTASTLFVRLQWDWGESMQARVLERVAYMKTFPGPMKGVIQNQCDCGCNRYPKAWTDAVGRVPCEPVPDCNW